MNVFSQDRTCEFEKSRVAASLTGYVDVTRGDEEALKQAVATVGPVSVAIDASHGSFQSYRSGQFLLILTFFGYFLNFKFLQLFVNFKYLHFFFNFKLLWRQRKKYYFQALKLICIFHAMNVSYISTNRTWVQLLRITSAQYFGLLVKRLSRTDPKIH